MMAIIAKVTIDAADLGREINQPKDLADLLNALGASLKPAEAGFWWPDVCEYLDDNGKAFVTFMYATLKTIQ
jgi:hypothetical protein